ncbi:hypothetical protein GCG54_00008180 [Colletotrichum gloeosporioides]|uniref:Uncharacterized protein n=1 Tax=Colletotrichum gloeosporioides TaxID=474922 RepID=A0A8H4FED7_COLGL|nr:uncharacterized protein GCG54_00008180 [Colletotrichum gloeosporioides]KAF3798726.1 hypothetical protein GCG54_00008180 [Colletotrichum gloeosporioides]
MDGICRTLSIHCKCSFFQDMPVAALDLYLLFLTTNTLERRPGFPSYTWAGWRMVDPAIKKSDWLSNHPWIIWYKYEPLNGAVSLVWDINQEPAFLEATADDVGYRSRRVFRPGRVTVDHTQYPYPLLQC